MARTEARFFASTWTSDDDWRALHPDAKLLYMFLLSQPELRHCGVITVSLRRWALRIGWDEDTLHAALKHALDARYVVVDQDTEELLVRTLIRNDGIWKQPKMLAAALADAARVESAALRAVILDELLRLDPSSLPDKTGMPVAALLGNLPERIAGARGDPNPPSGPAPQERNHEQQAPAVAPADPPGEGDAEGDRGRGDGNGGSIREPLAPIPKSQSPSPQPPGDGWGQAPLLPVVGLPAVKEEGGGREPETPQAAMTALVEELRGIRPEWRREPIRKALASPRCQERGWELTRRAALIVARDPKSIAPGRIPEDGDWWTRAAAGLRSAPPGQDHTVTCPVHRLPHQVSGECRSCAADRKAAS